MSEKNSDKDSYYQALRSYVLELHDSHTVLLPDPDNKEAINFATGLVNKHTAGSYGLVITKTSASQYVVSYVEPGSSADTAGIQAGDEILTWNNKPIMQAASATDVVWSDQYNFVCPGCSYAPPTQANVDYEQLRMMVRGSVGTTATVSWRSSVSHQTKSIALIANDDQGKIARKTSLYSVPASANLSAGDISVVNQGSPPETQISVNWLPHNYAQIKISGFDDGDYASFDENEKDSVFYKYLAATVNKVIAARPAGIVMDVRGNSGGDGRLAMDLAGFFTAESQAQFNIRFLFYNTLFTNYLPIPGWGPVYINGQTPNYTGPTVVLTDIGTVSAGEWAALAFQRIGKPVMSLYANTQGAFAGPVGAPFIGMPGNFVINFSSSRAYDENNNLLVESDGNLQGGVKTDVMIPLDANAAIDINTNGKDIALDYAIAYLKQHGN
ncbi:S41 family peptidase [Paraburkholderia fungorum]|uniref:S41 family peptidase n=1 Tax=Paraburkholderia fungorum TaxID=134537 RepID=UPI0038B761FA